MIPSLQKAAIAAFVLALLIAALLTPNLRRFAEAKQPLEIGWHRGASNPQTFFLERVD